MPRWKSLILLAAASVLAACAGRDAPTGASGERGLNAAAPASAADAARERLTRRFALALADPVFRRYLKDSLDRSGYREHKLYLQRLLLRDGNHVRRALARAAGDADSAVEADATLAGPLEVYLPVPEQRRAWQGDANLLVATALRDHDAPVAFDLAGRRRRLSADAPPAIPVLAVVPAETNFSRAPAPATCTPETCDSGGGGTGGGGGGSGGGPSGGSPAPGLYMTYSHFVQDFEGWLKGSPEFEIHILGQAGASDSLTDYQCAGEHAGGPYTFDQNNLDWNGSVLLFSQAQLDSYKAQHPNQSIRVFALEDDDTPCVIKTGQKALENIFAVVDGIYNLATGGKDTTTGITRIYHQATILQKLWAAAAGLIKTNDDLIGNAVEDVVVGQYYPGANWIVKGSNNVTNGWLKLVMY